MLHWAAKVKGLLFPSGAIFEGVLTPTRFISDGINVLSLIVSMSDIAPLIKNSTLVVTVNHNTDGYLEKLL